MHKQDADTWVLTLSNYDSLGRNIRYYKTYPGVGSETRTDRTITSDNMHDVVDEWWNQDVPAPEYAFDVPSIDNKFKSLATPPTSTAVFTTSSWNSKSTDSKS